MTSKLERYLSKELYTRFGQYSIRQNYRPQWMGGLELDFYIDELKLAAEVQGEQHYSFTKFFHKDLSGFEEQKKRDDKKAFICRERGIRLFEIITEKDADLFVQEIREITIPQKYFYRDDIKNKKHKVGLGYKEIVLLKRNIEKQKQKVLHILESKDKKDLTKFYIELKKSARTLVKYPKYIEENELEELNRIQKMCKDFL